MRFHLKTQRYVYISTCRLHGDDEDDYENRIIEKRKRNNLKTEGFENVSV